MSAKTTALNNILQAFKRWPKDTNRVYLSFKDYQMKKLQENITGPQASLPSAANLEQQAVATRLLTSDSNKRKFPNTEKLLEPTGMPNYYIRIVKEAGLDTRKKESFFTSFREAVFGWFR